MKIWELPFFQNLSVSDRKGLISRVAQIDITGHPPDSD